MAKTKKQTDSTKQSMKNVHIILQGKGGVGKSLIASILCQYIMEQKGYQHVLAIDTDPVNKTLSGYTALQALQLEIKTGDQIDQRKFDQLVDIIDKEDDDKQIIIDNGASSFIPLCSWMIENNTYELMQKMGCQVFFHSVVTGGMGMFDTMSGLNDMASQFNTPKSIIVWLNEYYGPITALDKDGDPYGFDDFDAYTRNQDKIRSIIKIPLKSQQTYGVDLEELFTRKQLFNHAFEDATLSIMTRQRLRIWWSEMCAQLESGLASIN